MLNKHDYITAVHSRRTSEVFVAIGGFKNMYPIIAKILKSNLKDVNLQKSAIVLSIILKILMALLVHEPTHIQYLMTKRNLISILRYCILKIGKQQMVTQEVLRQVQNIVLVVAQDFRSQEQFYQEFLIEFSKNIIFDIDVLTITCSGNENNSILVFNSFAKLIYDICCPIQNQGYTQPHFAPKKIDHYNILNQKIVGKETAPLLITLIERPQICQVCNLQQLFLISKSIARCILQQDDKETFLITVNHLLIDTKDSSLTVNQSMIVNLVNLQILYQVIRHEDFSSKKNLQNIYSFKDLNQKFILVLSQFDDHLNDFKSEDTLLVQDQIISVTLLLLTQTYLNKRTKYMQVQLNEKVAASDSEKKLFQRMITDNLAQNQKIYQSTYLTLMLIAMNKRFQVDNIPCTTDVQNVIQQCLVRKEQKSHAEIIDFDIDIFFFTISNLNRFTDETKLLLIEHFLMFEQYHNQNFMRLYLEQSTGEGTNPFTQLLKEFYYQIVQLAINNEVVRETSLKLAVQSCVQQLVKSYDQDQKKYLTKQDELGLWLIRRIILFFQPQVDMQLQVIQRIVKGVVNDVNNRKNIYTQVEQIKLNLKLINLLQFVEEMYVKQRVELNESNFFQETILLLMFLMEQIGLLTFDIPDQVSQDFEESASHKSYESNEQMDRKDLKMSVLKQSIGQNFQNLGEAPDIKTQLSYRQRNSADQNDPKSSFLLSQSSKIYNTNPRKQEETQLFQLFRRREDTAVAITVDKQKARTNFIGGGPVRILLHILLNSLAHNSNRIENFANGIELLRYLVLRERGGHFFTKTITKFFSQSYYTKSVVTYTLFSRSSYLQAIKRSKKQRQKDDNFGTPESLHENDGYTMRSSLKDQPVCNFILCEMKIFEITVLAMLKSTAKKMAEEQQADSRLQQDQVASFKDYKIAHNSYEDLKKRNKLGFTASQGFLIMQMISESIEILRQLVLIKESYSKIECLLNFLHSCLKDQFRDKNFKFTDDLFAKIIEMLIYQDSVKSGVRYFCHFLKTDLDQDFEDQRITLRKNQYSSSLSQVKTGSIYDYTSPLNRTESFQTPQRNTSENLSQDEQNETTNKSPLNRLSYEADNNNRSLAEMLKQQVIEFLEQLIAQLHKFVNETDQQQRQNILTQIIQSLSQDSQLQISLCFARLTSNSFFQELHQVRVNSREILRQINEEIQKMKFDQNKQPIRNQIIQTTNSLMQSQQFNQQVNKFERLSSQQAASQFYRRVNTVPNSSQQKHTIQESTEINTTESSRSFSIFLNENFNEIKYNLEYQHSKYLFKKVLKSLTEDVSSMWYDFVEEQQNDFKEIKDVYDAIQANLDDNVITAEKRQQGQINDNESITTNEDGSVIIKNPQGQSCFMKQRRVADSWGRMMLLKPNRKALNFDNWVYYDYYVFDFLNKIFAVSLLNDDEFNDLAYTEGKITLEQTRILMADPEFKKQLVQIAQSFGKDINEEEDIEPKKYSAYLQRVRSDVLQRMDRNHLLQKVLQNEKPLRNQKAVEDAFIIQKQKDKLAGIFNFERSRNAKVYQFEAQRIRINGTLWGHILVTKDLFVYMSACTQTPNRPDLKYTDFQDNSIEKNQLMIAWESIEEIIKRKCINIFQGVDIYTHQKKCYTFNLCSEKNCDEFIQIAKLFLQSKDEANYRIIENPKTYFNSGFDVQIVYEWKIGQRSTTEFLLLVNKYSGRSFNDLSQYPIFPWVLSDYKSSETEFRKIFKQNQCFRDFSKHTGNITSEKQKMLDDNYQQMLDDDDSNSIMTMQYGNEPFQIQYGFSNKMYVSQWLCRLEPFTAIHYQCSDFKKESRTPVDFDLSWSYILGNKQSNSELCPEHFYQPEMLQNLNQLSLGSLVYKKNFVYQIDSMVLPPWAMNAFDFVRIQREALESESVKVSLGSWIDLVFGVNQSSLQNQNLFFELCYEEWHENKKNRQNVEQQQLRSITEFYIAPSKIFRTSLSDEQYVLSKKGINGYDTEIKSSLIKAFVDDKSSWKQQNLSQIAVHSYLDASINIVHMIFNNETKCLVFVRQEDPQDRQNDTGTVVVYLCQETLSNNCFKDKSFDLSLRYEWVSDQLNHIFQVNTQKLFVAGYLDNSLKIFDLEAKPGSHLIQTVQHHHSRITCIKFSSDLKYFFSCDSDGVIIHYGQQNKLKSGKIAFPYQQLFKFQDQMDEIMTIDTNKTLDMYATISKDGTVSLRCQRTSTLWHQFKLFSKSRSKQSEKIEAQGFQKTFALKLSQHGYIVVVGQADISKDYAKYLVYNLSGDTLLAQYQERCMIKSVILNKTEDQLVVAMNYQSKDNAVKQANFRVFKLYDLTKLANPTNFCYNSVIEKCVKQKKDQKTDAKRIPVLKAIAMKNGESSLNLVFESLDLNPQVKEIICFEMRRGELWQTLEILALAPSSKTEI